MAAENYESIPLTKREVEAEQEHLVKEKSSYDGESSAASLSPAQEARYHGAVLFLAWFSVITLLILSVTSFAISQITGSVALFGFGLDALLDVATSLVVVWRFYGSSQTVYSRDRERIALLLLSMLFIAASLLLGIRSLLSFISGSSVEEILSLYIVSIIAVVTSVFLFAGKMYVGHKLKSQTVISDGYSSLACGVGSIGVIISACVHSLNNDIYYLDDIVGFSIAILLMGYGISLLVGNYRKPDDP